MVWSVHSRQLHRSMPMDPTVGDSVPCRGVALEVRYKYKH